MALRMHLSEDSLLLLIVSVAQYPIPIITPAEGSATQVAAAFDPSLESLLPTYLQRKKSLLIVLLGNNGAFLENCKPSETKEEWPWARGRENVDRLWALSEEMIGEKFVY